MIVGVSMRALAIRPLLGAAALVAVVVLAGWLLSRGADGLDATLTSLGAVVLLAVALWLFGEGIDEARDNRALRSMAPESRRAGAWIAVAGKAVALEDEIVATLTDRPALACSYKVLGEVRSALRLGESRRTLQLRLRYEGYHLAPTGIETADGLVPLKALPDLVNLERTDIGMGGAQLEHGAEHRSWFPPRYAARAQLAAQVRDRVDVNWRYPAAGRDSRRILRREWLLSPGEQVCVFGRWDGQALVPHPLRPRGLPVYAGSPEEVGRRLGGGAKVYLVLGAIPLLVAGWLLYGY